MELKEFIKQTIIQITNGLREGYKYIQDNNYGECVNDEKYKEVNFDVAVSSNEEETSGVGGGISVANIFSAGAKDELITKALNVSRIQLNVYLHVMTKQ